MAEELTLANWNSISKISFAKETSRFFGWRETAAVVIATYIVIWLLSSGWEWCRRQWKFILSAVMMPGPRALPLIGNALHFACKSDDLLDRLVQLGRRYNINPFRFWMGTKLFVVLNNPRDMEVLLNSPIATHKPYEYRFLASYLGPGLVTYSGATHRAHRKLIMPMVNGKSLNAYLECFDRQSRRCVECLEERVDTGEFDIIHYMDDCTLDMVLGELQMSLRGDPALEETIMGTAGTAQLDGYKGLIKCSARAIGLAHERSMKAWLYPDWIYFRTKDGQDYASDMEILHKFAETLVAQKKEEYYASGDRSDFPGEQLTAVLDRLTAHNEQTKFMTDVQLRDAIANVWMPAQDPTALSSSFLFMMLGMHPEVQDKLRAEVREVIGDGDITLEQISKLKYLDMVFKETVRLFPVGPVILRELQEDLEFETCTAPKGCTIAILVYMTHRDPKYWKDPEIFNPDRFTPENSVGRHPYAFVPFSSGIRGCIGRQYATMLMKTLVARVVQKYRISSKGSLETLRLKAGVSIRSIDGYKISITRV